MGRKSNCVSCEIGIFSQSQLFAIHFTTLPGHSTLPQLFCKMLLFFWIQSFHKVRQECWDAQFLYLVPILFQYKLCFVKNQQLQAACWILPKFWLLSNMLLIPEHQLLYILNSLSQLHDTLDRLRIRVSITFYGSEVSPENLTLGNHP